MAKEVEAVKRLGVEIEPDAIIGRTTTVDDLLDREGYDAVFVGSGAGPRASRAYRARTSTASIPPTSS